MRQVSRRSPIRSRGGVLLVVLLVVALLVMLVLSASVHVRLNWALADRILRREVARDAARSTLAEAVHALVADTNGVDGLDEVWATDDVLPLSDEESRINLCVTSAPILSALLEYAAGLPSRQAATLAQTAITWRSAQTPPPTALELFALAPGMNRAILTRIAPHATVHGQGRVNLNTASDAVLRILITGSGTPRETTDTMIAAFRAARRSGAVWSAIDVPTLATVFVGPRRIPNPAETTAITALAPLLTVSSSAFRGVSVGTLPQPTTPRHTIHFVYHRPTRTFLRWVE